VTLRTPTDSQFRCARPLAAEGCSSIGMRGPASADPHLPADTEKLEGCVLGHSKDLIRWLPGCAALTEEVAGLRLVETGDECQASRARSPNSAHRSVVKPMLQHGSSRIALAGKSFRQCQN
jgi:hypothetical protein